MIDGHAFCGICGVARTVNGPTTVHGDGEPQRGPQEHAPPSAPPQPAPDTPPLKEPPPTSYGGFPPPTRRRSRRTVLIAGGAITAAAAIGAVVVVNGNGPSSEDRYLEALVAEDLDGEFRSDQAAIREGRRFCEDLDGGEDPVGDTAQRLAVESFCPEFENEFEELDTIDVEGTFSITDSDGWSGGAGGCSGDGGYGDINASTAVRVVSINGDTLARTELGTGEGDVFCTFTFTFEVVEGEEQYIVEVGDRGEISYTFDELREPGTVALTIG